MSVQVNSMNRGAVRSDLLMAGFDYAVQDAQKVFRKVLKAMSEPGTILTADLTDKTPGALSKSSWEIALTLFDAGTKIWLSPTLAGDDAVVSNLRFHCQCPMVSEPAKADFALALADELPELKALNWGNSEYPDQSTTLIVQVEAVTNQTQDNDEGWCLTGPGIETERGLSVSGLPYSFRLDLVNSRKRFPLGVDCVFCADDQLVALPRSTEIKPSDSEDGISHTSQQEAN